MAEAYPLPTISTVSGDVNIVITSLTEGLTVPTAQTVKSLGKVIEAASINPEQQEIPRMTIKVMLDDTGFWIGVLYVGSTFMVTLTEGVTERYLFSGKLEPQTVDWTSTSNISGTRYGEVTFTLLSSIQIPMDMPTLTWIDEVLKNDITLAIPTSGLVYSVMSVRGLFAAMLSSVNPVSGDFLNSTYSLDDVTFVRDDQDLTFKTASADRDVSQLYVPTQWNDGGSAVNTVYFKTGDAENLAVTYATLKDLIGVMARNFGVRIRLYYDMDDSRYKIYLLQCYRAYSGTLDFSTRLKSETQSVSTDLQGDAAIVRYQRDATKMVWLSKIYSNMAFYVTDPSALPATKDVRFDFETTLVWHIMAAAEDGSPQRILSAASELTTGASHALLELIIDVTWHNYTAGTDDVATDPALADLKLEQAIAGYNGFRFIGTNWFKNTSRYSHITASDGATESFSHVTILKRQEISLGYGAGNKNYFANKTIIDIDNSEVEVEWIQEEK